jgi:hypothetical protein
MKTQYQVGSDDGMLYLEVTVGTPGSAQTVANQLRLGGEWTRLAESKADGGGIPATQIGQAKALRTSYLLIQTIVDFSLISPSQWSQLAEKLLIRYHLSDEISEGNVFQPDPDDVTISQHGKLLLIVKAVELV